MKNIYPVIFTDTKDIVLVEVPDLEILTEGQDVLNAIEMARDAIALKGMTMENKYHNQHHCMKLILKLEFFQQMAKVLSR